MLQWVLFCFQGQAAEIQIQADRILHLREKLNKLLAKNTNQTLKRINNDTKRDHYMDAEEAMNYGIVDKILK